MTTVRFEIHSPSAMTALGHAIGKKLFAGAVVGLVGTLGAGKTFLVRAIAEGMEIANSRVVNSPTFVLIQEYAARLPIYHFDAYRLSSETELMDLGVDEYFSGEGVCLIEWADRVQGCLPKEKLTVTITITGEESRKVEISAQGSEYERLLKELGPG